MAGIKCAYKSLRCLQLYLTLQNVVNQHLIFTWKLVSIGDRIVSGYAAIAHFSDHPIFGLMYYVIFFDILLIYPLVYGNAFRIPAMFEDVKVLLRLCGLRYTERVQWKILTRSVNSIPAVGVKVGDFHTLERTSTPIFLNYVLTNVVNMLVAHK